MKSIKSIFACFISFAVLFICGCVETPVSVTETDALTETDASVDTDVPTESETAEPEPEPAPVPSAPGGLYREALKVSFSIPGNAPPGAYVSYTENGDEPDADSEKYVSELDIAETKVIRASLFSADGKRLGRIVTNTYIISGGTGLYTVALTVDNDDLYSKDKGIFENREGSGSEWERPVSVEIYGADGTALIRQDAGIRVAGSGSRSFDPASLRIVARESSKLDKSGVKYSGDGKFRADLFGSGFDAYDRFLLRNGGNDSPYQARDNFLRMNLLRDCISNEYCLGFSRRAGVSVFAQECVPVRVYLNGEYYGMSVLKEDVDERLLSEKYGLDKDKITVIKGKKLFYQLESGADSELEEWLSLCAYAAENALGGKYGEAYDYVSDKLDTDNAAAYLAVMLYLCNTDWPQNNVMVWRYTGEPTDQPYSDGKWRFIIRDMDLCFALHDEASRVSKTTYTMADTDTFYRLLVFYRDGKGYSYDKSLGLYGDDMKIQGLYDFLLRSDGFREKFVGLCETLASDAEASYMKDAVKKYRAAAENEIKNHIEHWKAKGKICRAYTYSSWKSSFAGMEEFINDRPAYFGKYLENTLGYYAPASP